MPLNDETIMQAFLTRVLTPLMVSAMVGVWAFASTRAGDNELARVEKKGEQREEMILGEIEKIEGSVNKLEAKIHRLEIEQAEFRAQVRAALRISEEE